ncbi:ADAMTS-like protein 1 isoform X4 [Polypterus senegalus]|uniref:ADAMTS-like protein 1 isoform X4 n=1 Tax=Polypterus senegalus TaxID=55291 RepID=UPI001963718C|nr:ADAMTS-like protein 1 isoform X4 [Polypterus senegalus]
MLHGVPRHVHQWQLSVGCDHELGSTAKEDNCGVCNGDGSTCRLVRGHFKSQHSAIKREDTVIAIPFGSRHVRLVLKGPDHLYLESKTLQGRKGENSLSTSGSYPIENTTVDFQKFADKEILRMSGPLGADFTVKIHYVSPLDSTVQFIFYQPIIHRWRETDFFPCSATCGGGYQLTSAECFDLRSSRVVPDQYCHYYPENVKPKPKLQECNMDPCPASDGFKQIMPYDLYHPLPRWDHTPWTACSTSCGGGIQSRTASCVEEDMQGNVVSVEEWKCTYAPKMAQVQPCNVFDCPKWLAQEWSSCTVTCGQGLRYRVVLCIDHRGIHAGGCNPKAKPHIKEDCVAPIPCYKPKEKLPVEAKLPWYKQAQELDEETAVTEEPSFVPDVWSPCSRTCGVGTQQRTVKCQVLLSFSQTVADLPEDECEGPKPQVLQSCYSGPCGEELHEPHAEKDEEEEEEEEDEEVAVSHHTDEELHDWEYEGFTECSESCGGGLQEAVVVCLNQQTRQIVEEGLCTSHRRPPSLLKTCHPEPCPPRWEAGKWSSCSATCGVGLQTRDVVCTHLLSRENNETVVVSEDKCRHSKPAMVQACNRFDCPPSWYPQDWQQCSKSCGLGLQFRQVLCKQRMADGSFLELPETFCSSQSPSTQQTCGKTECPVEWAVLERSQCSVTCGEGSQSISVFCRKMDRNGKSVTLNPGRCSSFPQPRLVKPCSLAPCTKPSKPVPKLTANMFSLRKVYIQLRKERRLQFVVGGYAFLIPATSVVIRCPIRRLRKTLIRWEKDGKLLAGSSHLTVSPYGYLSIHHLRLSDAGIYTCIAGQAQENFIIKLTGFKQKPVLHPPGPNLKDKPWISPRNLPVSVHNAKLWLTPGHFSQYDDIVLRLIEKMGLDEEHLGSLDALDSSERNSSLLEDDFGLEVAASMTLTIDQKRLDELIKNILSQPEELQSSHADKLVTQLLSEIHADNVLKYPDGGFNASNSWKSTDHKSHPSEATLANPESPEFGDSDKSFRPPVFGTTPHHQKRPHETSSSEFVGHVGQDVLLHGRVNRLVLKCEATGNPKPSIRWSKNGEHLRFGNRVGMLPDGSLQILAPGAADAGIYRCTASNSLGFVSLSSHITQGGKPVIRASISTERVFLNTSSVMADVGSTVKVLLGANVTLRCQAEGIPKPKISWSFLHGKSEAIHHPVKNDSVLVGNASLRDEGHYVCRAANLHGQVTAMTHLLLLVAPHVQKESARWTTITSSAEPGTHTLLSTETGTTEMVGRGSTVLIGCFIQGQPTPRISWLQNGKSLSLLSDLTYQLLEGDQVLQLSNVSSRTNGEVSCLAENEAGTLLQRVLLVIHGHQWSVDDTPPCSATCGNKGIRSARLRCLFNGTEVDRVMCRHEPRPSVEPLACNVRDCPPRWLLTPWSPCSRTCGGGVQSRRVTCHQETADRLSVTLPAENCTSLGKRPTDLQPCNRMSCAEWTTSAWGQCNGECVGLRQSTQHRQLFCQMKTGIPVPASHCSGLPRPPSSRNCTTDACNLQWRVGSWTPCTATCGTSGFQTRRVECIHLRSGKAGREQLCSWKPRPANWQHCNIRPCESAECRDTTIYCEKVQQLKLCHLPQFGVRCCESCKAT